MNERDGGVDSTITVYVLAFEKVDGRLGWERWRFVPTRVHKDWE